jgi:DNA-binding PadR family transcriptional regulator
LKPVRRYRVYLSLSVGGWAAGVSAHLLSSHGFARRLGGLCAVRAANPRAARFEPRLQPLPDAGPAVERPNNGVLTDECYDISLSDPDTLESYVRRVLDKPGHEPHCVGNDGGPSPLLLGGRDSGPFGRPGFPPAGRGGGRDGGPFGPGAAGGFGWNPFRSGHRARRGDIRAAILALLREEPRNGYQIMQEIKQRSQGMWNPSPGSVYPALQQLEDERLIANEEKPAGRVYALTSQGKVYVKGHADEIAAPWEALANAGGEAFVDVMGLARQLGGAAMQVVQAGDAAQIAKAKRLLVATRRSLYEILAQGSSDEE